MAEEIMRRLHRATKAMVVADAERAAATREEERERARLERLARRQQKEAARDVSGYTILGIDPGERGAVALLRAWRGRDEPQLDALGDASDARRVRQLVPEADLIVLEGQSASPQMGVASAFSLGEATGRLQEAVQAGLRGQVVVTYPARWKASYGLLSGGKADSLKLACRLLGTDTALSRHDEAEAVLLAWWGWRNVLLANIGTAEAG
jgi:hypothetical protein